MKKVAGKIRDAGGVAYQPGAGPEEGALLRSSCFVREQSEKKDLSSSSCALLQLLETTGFGEVFAVLLANYLHSSDIRSLLIASPSIARSAAIREALFFSLCLRQQRAPDYSTASPAPQPPAISPLPSCPSLPPSASHPQDALPPLPPQPPALLLPPPPSAGPLSSMPFLYSPILQKKETDDEHEDDTSSCSQLFAAVLSREGRVSVQRSGLRVNSCMEFYFQFIHHSHCHECYRKLYETEEDDQEAEHMAAFTSARKRDKRTPATTITANKGDSPPLSLCDHCRLLLCANSPGIQTTVADLISHRTLFGQLLGKMSVSLPAPKQWTETSLRIFLGFSHGGLLLYLPNWKLLDGFYRTNSRLLLQRWRTDFLSSSAETYGLSFSRLCLEPLFEMASKYASRASAATDLSHEANWSRRTDLERETGEMQSAALISCGHEEEEGEEQEMRGGAGQPKTLEIASNADDIDAREEEESARTPNLRWTGDPTSAEEEQTRQSETGSKEIPRHCRHCSSSLGLSLSRRRRQDKRVLEEVRDLLLLLGRVGSSGIAAAREADSETVSLLQQTHHRESDYYHMLVASVYVVFRMPFLLFQHTTSLTTFGRQAKVLRAALDAFCTLYCHPDLKGLSEIIRQWLACRFPSTSHGRGGIPCGGSASKESTSPSLAFPSYDSIPLTEAFDQQALVHNYLFGVTFLFFQQRDGNTLKPGKGRLGFTAADEEPPTEGRRRRGRTDERDREAGNKEEEEEGFLCLRYQKRLRLFPFGRKERKLIVETLLLPFLFAQKLPFQQTAPNREAEGTCAKREQEEEKKDNANHKHQERRKPDSSHSLCIQPCPSSSHLLFRTPKRSIASVDSDHRNYHPFPLPKALCTS